MPESVARVAQFVNACKFLLLSKTYQLHKVSSGYN